MVGTQRLLDLLLGASRRGLHRAAEPVEHPLERELLHREFVARILCPRAAVTGPGYITAVRRGPRAGFGGRRVARSRALRFYCAVAAETPGAADAATRARRRSTKTRRGTASGMYGNAVPLPIDTRLHDHTRALLSTEDHGGRHTGRNWRNECEATDRTL